MLLPIRTGWQGWLCDAETYAAIPSKSMMDMAHYHYLRECELDAALAQTRADMAAGRIVQESPEAHLARLDAANAGQAS